MTIIYGIDTEKPVSAHDVRDAIVACFVAAHAEALEDLKNYALDMKPEEFERLKIINVQQMIRGFFTETGGNFEEPTKDSIMLVIGKLKEFADNFRNPEIVQTHFSEIIQLIQKL